MSSTCLLLLLTYFAANASANDPQSDFLERAKRLRSQQALTDQLVTQIKAQAGVNYQMGGSAPQRTENAMQPLFKVHAEVSQQKIPAGKMLFGQTFNRLVVGADGSPSLIELDEAQGSLSRLRVMGVARQSGTQGRVAIAVTRLLLRTGTSVPVQATTLDASGGFGLEAQVFSSKAAAIGGALASSFVSGLAAGSQSQVTGPFGFAQTETTGRNAVLQGVAQTAADQSKRFIEEATKEKPILVVEPGTPVTLLFDEEVRF
jgi:hypothetical protein